MQLTVLLAALWLAPTLPGSARSKTCWPVAAPASLEVPELVAMERLDDWKAGPRWPEVAESAVVVTPHADDRGRFMAFLVDVKERRIVAVRDGDTRKHLAQIGPPANHRVPVDVSDEISGAVIIVRPPKPPGPRGLPKDLVARIVEVGVMAGRAERWMDPGSRD
ncbi:hypothetical protein [Nannocystis bainbridge]|uniref:Uncharacterized protein n=1 Tax=Nannocystis bainbridge TaxID=2995303 RepID=A0ABT5E7B1_9BACT|nr:hypothetical protein [Nannocystis bainbridge]MDC0721318.1 hypothetical protein [Nannocystis bainbridge]